MGVIRGRHHAPESGFCPGGKCATVLLSHRAEATRSSADVAQLVERNLAKVEVAGSNPVVRSERVRPETVERLKGGVAERLGSGLQSRPRGFESRLHLENLGNSERS